MCNSNNNKCVCVLKRTYNLTLTDFFLAWIFIWYYFMSDLLKCPIDLPNDDDCIVNLAIAINLYVLMTIYDNSSIM